MTFKIVKVDTVDKLTGKLIEYARDCSFQGTGSYLSDLLSDNAFEDYEKVFAAIYDDEIIGFAALLKECDCVDNDCHSPWLDFLFVDEKYRNQHIGVALIKNVCDYALSIEFNSIYLCTVSHVGYYEKVGFKDIYTTNYFNGVFNENCIHVMQMKIG